MLGEVAYGLWGELGREMSECKGNCKENAESLLSMDWTGGVPFLTVENHSNGKNKQVKDGKQLLILQIQAISASHSLILFDSNCSA